MFTLLGNLGIDIPLLLAQVVNFSVLLFVLHRFLYKPIIARIEDDERFMNRILKKEDELEKEEARLTLLREQHEVESKRRAEQLMHDAEEIAHEIRERARNEAQQEKAAVISQIRSRLEDLHNERHT